MIKNTPFQPNRTKKSNELIIFDIKYNIRHVHNNLEMLAFIYIFTHNLQHLESFYTNDNLLNYY